MRWIILLMLLMIPIAYGLEECMREQMPKDIPCYLITGGSSTSCTSTEAYFYSENGSLLFTETMSQLGDSGRCNITFNLTSTGQYTINSSLDTWNVLVEQEDDMTSLGIILFLIIFTGTLFLLPFYVKFSKKESFNNIWKGILWVLAMAFLAFTTTILVTLADNAGLPITGELFAFQWIFIKALYVGMVLISIRFLFTTMKMIKLEKQNERMGGE